MKHLLLRMVRADSIAHELNLVSGEPVAGQLLIRPIRDRVHRVKASSLHRCEVCFVRLHTRDTLSLLSKELMHNVGQDVLEPLRVQLRI